MTTHKTECTYCQLVVTFTRGDWGYFYVHGLPEHYTSTAVARKDDGSWVALSSLRRGLNDTITKPLIPCRGEGKTRQAAVNNLLFLGGSHA